jgi:heme exporter protein A
VTGAAPSGRADAELVCSTRALRKEFGFRDVLRGIDFDAAPGTCSVIFGDNGAGKSTFLRILSTQMRASSGRLSIGGVDPARDPVTARRRIGVVSHQSFLRGELTLAENLRFYSSLYGVERTDAAARWIERVGLAARRDDFVRTFSQGMTQRANIARSLLHGPELWLLDEPFSGLDPSARSMLSGLVKEFIAAGGAAVLVTHDIELGQSTATHLYRVEAGRLTVIDRVGVLDRAESNAIERGAGSQDGVFLSKGGA